MRPATIPGGVRERTEYSTTHDSAMEDNGDQKSPKQSSALLTDEPSPGSNFITDQSHDSPQPYNFGLRHNLISSGANVNMPDAYARIQAYKPPTYVSPYGPSTNVKSAAANNGSDLSTGASKPRRLSSRDNPPWLCCFAQKRIPEWSRHPEIWNPGTAIVCTASVPHPCQHKKCEDCLWESLEEAPEDTISQNLSVPEATKTCAKADAFEPDGDPEGADSMRNMTDTTQKSIAPYDDSPGMTPSGILVPNAINRDPKTGRLRLWPKD
ncbi:hypothetical protein BKA64DRAFT_707146 [Cadophora sp. MPI-SDFR-AT-0126]|nr:hypothetical protein BKA64DRAFT_707146 [Leotiomycetes sp. MPI-SDFR-AT-0126]